MSDVPTPEEVEEHQAKNRIVAGMVREHYEALKHVGFAEDEAFELASNYHWALLVGGEIEE